MSKCPVCKRARVTDKKLFNVPVCEDCYNVAQQMTAPLKEDPGDDVALGFYTVLQERMLYIEMEQEAENNEALSYALKRFGIL